MSNQTYQGWANRETWCMNLWLNNDEGLYNHCKGMASIAKSDCALADEIEGFVLELFDDDQPSKLVRTWKDDVGYIWRVDWVEIAAGFMED